MPWVYGPHSGGTKIPERTKQETKQRILDYAKNHYAGKYTSIDVRFKKQFCYIDAYTEPFVADELPSNFPETREEYIEMLKNTPTHLCRLRYFDEDRWSIAFYTYSNEKYEPTYFHGGADNGTPEEGFDVGAVYLE